MIGRMTTKEDIVPSVLIVDDTPANLLALEAVLESLEVRIVRAESGKQAVEEALADDFAVIVLDVHMPRVDGYETLSMLRRSDRSRDVPVILVTAIYDQHEHVRRGYALGAIDYVSKPYDPEIMRAKVGAMVALYRRARLAERRRNEEQDRLRDMFIGILGHDLRNPLNAIAVATELMLRGDELDPKGRRRAAEQADKAVRRMGRLIDDLMDLTVGQLGAGIPVAFQPADLGMIGRTAVEECGLAHSNRVVKLEAAGNLRGNWDGDRLSQATSNLITNALRSCPTDPIVVTVRDDGDSVVLEVHYQGPPISDEELPTLFEPFRRGRHPSDGLGLGLYIAHEIVRAHRGDIAVQSSAANGTTFKVTLPRQPGE
jgi:signal transduction histidine kinase